jgi:hypothetical protein
MNATGHECQIYLIRGTLPNSITNRHGSDYTKNATFNMSRSVFSWRKFDNFLREPQKITIPIRKKNQDKKWQRAFPLLSKGDEDKDQKAAAKILVPSLQRGIFHIQSPNHAQKKNL